MTILILIGLGLIGLAVVLIVKHKSISGAVSKASEQIDAAKDVFKGKQ
jgi:hypothetical protein